jgi:hypothetical protein
MRRTIALILALAVSGCTPHRVAAPTAAAVPAPPSDWSAVAALPRGHYIVVTLDGVGTRPAIIWRVTETTLTIRALDGEETFERALVARVAERVQTETKDVPRYLSIPTLTAILGGIAGIIIGAINKNGRLQHASAVALGAGLGVGLGLGQVYPTAVYGDRVVYVRQ